MSPESVGPENYTEGYFEASCGGADFFRLYGAKVLKPPLAYAFKRAGILPGMKVLDIGCGRGELLHHARQAGAEATGTDFSPAAVRLAAEVSGCRTVLCDAKALPFENASFDRVFFLGVMDHLHDWELEACFAEIGRVLKPGGLAVVHTCANRHYYKNWTYALRLALARLLRLREPRPPRSGEDFALHVNEHTLGGMRDFFRRIGWRAIVEARPNYKLVLRPLYGDPLPANFPMKPAPPWKARLYLGLLFRPPLDRILAREFFAVVRPPEKL